MNKTFYFLCSLPRSGNTLLGSLINQDKNVCVTSNSIVPDILFNLHNLKKDETFKMFPDHKSLNNVIYNVFNNYYKDWKQSCIIERGEWGLPINLILLKSIFKNIKFIILYRPIIECLASYIRILKPLDVKNYCKILMSEKALFGRSINSINNVIKNKENFISINYNDLVQNPYNQIKKIYNFIGLPLKKLNLKNFNQFKVNGIKYNDIIFKGGKLHQIRTEKINLNNYKIEDYIPNEVIKEFNKKYINI